MTKIKYFYQQAPFNKKSCKRRKGREWMQESKGHAWSHEPACTAGCDRQRAASPTAIKPACETNPINSK